jgi:L-xylulokinase
MTRYLLGIDAGQSAIKAVLHDERLRPVAISRRSSPLTRDAPRHAQRSQEDLWGAAADAIADVIRTSSVSPADIAGVAVAGHGDGLHLVDAAGEPVGPAITAVDTRAHREAEELYADADHAGTILRLSGQIPPVGSAGLLMLWLVRNDPTRLERAHAMLFCKDVIRLRLTGEIATDYSDATASFLDTSTATWSEEILAAYGLSEFGHLLPQVLASADSAGTVTARASQRTGLREGTPVAAGLHDVQAASLGMGALTPGRLAMSAGSFSTNGVTTRQTDVDPRWQSRLSITPRLRIAMSTSPTASPTLDWTLRLLGISEDAARDSLFAQAAELSPQESVPMMLPYLHGAAFDPAASAALAGVRAWHTRAHVLRGALEGIALTHYWHTRALSEKFTWDRPLVLGGGLARAPLYVQLVANVLRSPIAVVRNEEAGAFGAAAIAGLATGVFDSVEAAQELVESSPVIEPTDVSAEYWANVTASFDGLSAQLGPWWAARNESEAGRK